MLLVNAWVIVMPVVILIYRLQKGQAWYTFYKNDTLHYGNILSHREEQFPQLTKTTPNALSTPQLDWRKFTTLSGSPLVVNSYHNCASHSFINALNTLTKQTKNTIYPIKLGMIRQLFLTIDIKSFFFKIK